MSLISDGIERVRAIELPGGIRADGGYVAAPRVALVRWWSNLSGMFYQVYVNGRFAGATGDAEQRAMVVRIPTSLGSAVRIEVFAVEAKDAYIDFGGEIEQSPANSGRVKITLLRTQNLPTDATANIYFDNGGGSIDYDQPVNGSPIRIWPSRLDKAGFAMSRFGEGDFGWDSAAAVGFGKACFGNGQFGLDADTIEWISEALSASAYRFGVKVTDGRGNEGSASEIGPIAVTPAARPAERLRISSFDQQTGELVLEIEGDAS